MGELLLTQIWIYPIKSMGGIQLPEAQVMAKGLKHDRRWMLVDEAGRFLTQRVYPAMALFKVELNEAGLVITYERENISVPFDHSPIPTPLDVKIWDDTVTAFEVSIRHSEWFSHRVGLNCRLVAFPEENPRQIEPEFAKAGENVSLADGYPFLIIGQSSLDDLNTRLAEPVSIKRFRPNLVFTGGKPYIEDSWKDFSIGVTRFQGVKPCARCVLVTINPDTAVKGVEPLRTLANYRRQNNKTYFGQNLISVDHDVIRTGDLITVKNTHVLRGEQLAGTS